MERLGAPSIRFDAAKHINTPARLIEAVSWQNIPSDDPVPPLKADHCRLISHAIAAFCDNRARAEAADETRAILDAYLNDAEPLDGYTTRGTSAQRYETARALRRPADAATLPMPLRTAHYLIDHGETGEVDDPELVIRVSDLFHVVRRLVGSKPWMVRRRMEEIGWTRLKLDGHESSGRSGRQGPHARCDVYRGRR